MAKHLINSSALVENLKNEFPKVAPRYERKYRVPVGSEENIKSILLSIGFNSSYPDRKVISQYFDTNNLDFARDNIDGARERIKIRLRSYDEASQSDKLKRLEIKSKDGFLGYKYLFETKKTNSWEIEGLILEKTGILTKANCITFYDRSYYTIITGVRATVDKGLFCINLLSGSLNETSLGYSVLEIKYPANLDAIYRNLIQPKLVSNIPLRLNKSSKYVESLLVQNQI